ncbi:hypothetical protein AB0A98_22635 [Streptomyces chrestomyceticus]|uniref:hypothetical protein n=1 Tax=Streptomyces chrestomyceticus TaxID=68185 RepID=UPI0033D42636
MSPADDHAAVVAGALGTAYGIRLAAVTRIRSGTATANFHVRDHLGEQWFAKVYRDGADLSQELAALELSRFARDGGLPVPAVRPTLSGDLIARHGRLALSL